MNKKEIYEKIEELCKKGNEVWNHQYYFPFDVKTRKESVNSPGYNLDKWERLKPILNKINIKDKTLLDVGCSDGYYAIESAKLDAKHVLGTDLDGLRIERAKFAKKILNIKNVDFKVQNVYDLSQDEKYDIVMALGFLHRIPDMIKFLSKVCEISNTIIVEFKTYRSIKDDFIDHGGESKSNSHNRLYVTPSIHYVRNRFIELGHKEIEVYEDKLSNLKYPRTIVVARKK